MDAKQLAEIKAREQAVTNNPVRYYKDGRPFVQFAAAVIEDHPIVECLARLDRYEKYIIPSKDQQIDELTEKLKKTAALGTKWADEILLKDEQIATLKNALETALEDLLDAAVTPCSYCRYNPSNGGICDMTTEHHEMFSCWVWQGVDPQRAQEQEAQSNG